MIRSRFDPDPLLAGALAIAAIGAVVGLRGGLDPWLGNSYPFVTLYFGVVFAAWFGGWRAALPVMLLGWAACAWLYAAPRGTFGFGDVADAIGTVLRLAGLALLIVLGESLRRAERRAHAQRLLLEEIGRAAPDLIYAKDLDGRLTFANPATLAALGRTAAQAIGRNELERAGAPPRERAEAEAIMAADRRVMSTGRSETVEEPFTTPAGTRVYHSTKVARRDASGAVIGLVGSSRDLTERFAAERMLRTALGAARMVAWGYDARTDRVIASDNVAEVYGLAPGTTVETAAQGYALLHPDDAGRHRAAVDAAIEAGTGWVSEFRIVRPIDGRTVWLQEHGHVERPSDGGYRLHGVVLDVSVRHRQEEDAAENLATMTRLQALAVRLLRVGDEPDAPLRDILRAAAEITGTDKGNIQRLDAETGELRIVCHQGHGAAFLRHFEAHGWVHTCNEAAARVERVIVDDVAALAATSADPGLQVVLDDDIRAIQSTPLVARDGRLLGMLSNHFRQPGRPSEREQRALDLLARMAADYLERTSIEQALREADRRKDHFLGMLAHELRNPLAPIRNAVALLHRSAGDGTPVRSAAALIERQVRQMVRLIDDLLDVSRVTRGAIELRRERVELADIVDGAVESARPHLIEHGHHLEMALPPAPLALHADRARLVQALGNLLHNAAKFTPPGGHIALRADADEAEVTIRVRDDGVGIAPELLPQVFELFVQADGSLERATSGLGIGLTLVRQLVELHGGQVSATSDGPGRGCEFVLRLPRAPHDSAPAPDDRAVDSGVHATPPSHRVLVVDDNVDSADSLAALLQLLGHRSHVAHDGLEAVDAAQRLRPSVVLLDIGLPKLNGYDAARRMRELPGAAAMTIVALTGWGREVDLARSREAGIDAHLVKPVATAELLQLLASLPAGQDALAN